MKHFVIDYYIGSHAFSYECTTAYEALTALVDLSVANTRVGMCFDADAIMEILLDMKKGEHISHTTPYYGIHYVDGEV